MRLYEELAEWWPLLSPPSEYEEEAAAYASLFESEQSDAPVQTILELGSGGGHNAVHLSASFDLTLVDLSEAMLEMSRALNPGCRHIRADMRGLRLNQTFDGVFVHDAICYMVSENDLLRVMETAFVHCEPGGVALFVPDYVRESFRATTTHGGVDDETRGMRYLEWTHDPDPTDCLYTVDYAFMLREADGSVRHVYDRHIEGLFDRPTWIRLLRRAGFDAIDQPPVVLADGTALEIFRAVRMVR